MDDKKEVVFHEPRQLFEKIKVKEEKPTRSGWYDTDRGELYFFLHEILSEWSCRDDRISAEYPKVWYKRV